MKIRILGSAAGGGFPQWNCNCANCRGIRSGEITASARTQSSIAVSADGQQWILFNVSPDIRVQLESFEAIRAPGTLRGSGISAIILMDSQIDHTTGLLMLREGCPHEVYCSESVHDDLSSGFPLFNILEAWNGGLRWHPIQNQRRFVIPGFESLGLTPIYITSNAPPYSPHRDNPRPGDNMGIMIEDGNSGRSLFYAPGLGAVDDALMSVMQMADCLLVDGTFWTENELATAGVGTKPASAMGHLPQAGAGGMIEVLATLPASRKVLIHINNTNPILDEKSDQRRQLNDHNIEVAYDGMDILL